MKQPKRWKAKLFGEESPVSVDSQHTQHQLKQEENEERLDKINIHRIYNKNEEFMPSGQCDRREEEGVVMQFGLLLNESQIDQRALKTKSWQGIPSVFRGVVWKVLLDYQPTNRQQWPEALGRLRQEYHNYVVQYCPTNDQKESNSPNPSQNFTKTELNMIRVVETDVPRTQPMYQVFKYPQVQAMLKRILIIWGLRHPACGYVQGINEIATPFLAVFLSQYCSLDGKNNFDLPSDIEKVKEEIWQEIEADTYWCLSRVLDKIQDNYTTGQPGIKRSLDKMAQIIQNTDPELAAHFKSERVEYVQFSFRWILCLLIREFPFQQVLRVFDTYLADDKGVGVLHVYVCAALVLKFSKKIKKMSFNDIITFFQNLPTEKWSDSDVEILLSEAFVFMSLYENSQGHIKPTMNFAWH